MKNLIVVLITLLFLSGCSLYSDYIDKSTYLEDDQISFDLRVKEDIIKLFKVNSIVPVIPAIKEWEDYGRAECNFREKAYHAKGGAKDIKFQYLGAHPENIENTACVANKVLPIQLGNYVLDKTWANRKCVAFGKVFIETKENGHVFICGSIPNDDFKTL